MALSLAHIRDVFMISPRETDNYVTNVYVYSVRESVLIVFMVALSNSWFVNDINIKNTSDMCI